MRKAGFVTVVIFLQRRARNGSTFWLIAVGACWEAGGDLLGALSGFAFILFLVMLLVRRLVKTLPHSKETLVAYQVVSTQKLIVDTTLPVSTLHHIAEVRSVNIGEQWQEVLYS